VTLPLRVPGLLAGAAAAASAVALLDPQRPLLAVLGAALAGAAVLTAPRPRPTRLCFAAALGVAWALAAFVSPEFRSDSGAYFAHLRSPVFDRDLSYDNEWTHWGYPPPFRTPTGLARNMHSVGPAVLWSPFYLLAHLYVWLDLAPGTGLYPRDGFSLPYVRACALGTVAVALAGAWLLVRTLTRDHGPALAALAVGGVVLLSPILYYVFVVPSMAHGLCFGVAAALVWAWDRARHSPSRNAWILLGALCGLLTLIRWQAPVYALLVAPLAAHQLHRRTVRPAWLLGGAAAGLLAFTPQLLAWRVLYGTFLTFPQGEAYVDWRRSPHVLDTLLSADHGLFSWTPAMALGVFGLAVGLRRERLFHAGALLVFAATAWVNGGVSDWSGSDAYGARRFDLVVPLLAPGMAIVGGGLAAAAARAPLLVPAAAVLLMGLWNVGLVILFRQGRYSEMAPLERLAGDQGRLVRRGAEGLLGALAGARGRALAYKYFSSEYFYTGFNTSGTIDLWAADDRYLLRGWGNRSRRTLEPSYRWALPPEACVRLPLSQPFDIPITIAAWSPEPVQPQVMTVEANGRFVGSAHLGTEWTDVRVTVPARDLVPGENTLCLRFSNATRPERGPSVAACVSRIQLP
jgi:hypothetical protein